MPAPTRYTAVPSTVRTSPPGSQPSAAKAHQAMASTLMQSTDTRDFAGFYALLAGKAPGALPVTIPDTVFFTGEGCPVARYLYSTAEQRVVEVAGVADDCGPTLSAVGEWAHAAGLEPAGPLSPPPFPFNLTVRSRVPLSPCKLAARSSLALHGASFAAQLPAVSPPQPW